MAIRVPIAALQIQGIPCTAMNLTQTLASYGIRETSQSIAAAPYVHRYGERKYIGPDTLPPIPHP